MASPISSDKPKPSGHEAPFNGFRVSADGKTAEKEFKVKNKTMILKVVFDKKLDPATLKKTVDRYTDERLEIMGKLAISIGLTAEGRGREHKIANAILLRWEAGALIVQKQFKDGHIGKEIKGDHYADKCKKDKYKAPDSQKKVKKQMKYFERLAKELAGTSKSTASTGLTVEDLDKDEGSKGSPRMPTASDIDG